MASSTKQIVQRPLSDFEKIGHNIFLWTSETYSAKSPLVLFFSWNAAAAKHITKYLASYRKLFPSARILLIRCNTPDTFRREGASQKLLLPALSVFREHVKNGGEVLLHSFSNGGAIQLVEFAKLWKKEEGTPLPIHAQCLDSSPGNATWMRGHAAISLSLPRTVLWRIFGGLLVHFFLFGWLVFNTISRKEHLFIVTGKAMNDSSMFPIGVPRVYLYSNADEMIMHEDVEEHADTATALGYGVRKVKFNDSPHCGHIREDEQKYWGAVMDAWGRRMR